VAPGDACSSAFPVMNTSWPGRRPIRRRALRLPAVVLQRRDWIALVDRVACELA
jgi:hypothetical protein